MNEVKRYINHLQEKVDDIDKKLLVDRYYGDRWRILKSDLIDVKNASNEMYVDNELVDEDELLKISKKYPFMSYESRMFLGLPEPRLY